MPRTAICLVLNCACTYLTPPYNTCFATFTTRIVYVQLRNAFITFVISKRRPPDNTFGIIACGSYIYVLLFLSMLFYIRYVYIRTSIVYVAPCGTPLPKMHPEICMKTPLTLCVHNLYCLCMKPAKNLPQSASLASLNLSID